MCRTIIVREPEAVETMQEGDHEMDETKREMSDVLKNIHKDVLKEIKNIGILVREGGRKDGKTAVAE